MRRTAPLYGLIGLILLAFGTFEYLFAPGFKFFVWVNLAGGFFAIILWITSSGAGLLSLAGQRTTRYGANAVIYSAGFIGLLVAVNYLSTLHHRRLDLTTEKVYSLSSQSEQIVKQLKKPLKFSGFFQGGDNPQARELYSMYAYASPLVSFELVDPDRHPELAERYKISTLNVTHVQYGGETGEGTNVTETTEEALTNAIIRVAKAGKKVVDFLDGHGEADPDDTQDASGMGELKKDLEGEGYEVRKLVLASLEKVPDDVTMVVVAGPIKPLLPPEIDRLNAYLKRGGRMIVMLRPPRPDQSVDEDAVIALVGQWGVKAGNDVVVDQVVRLFAGPALGLTPLVQDYGDHPITRNFRQRTVFPMVRSLTVATDAKPGLELTALAKTSETSWAETDLEGIFKRQEAKLTEKDIRGPITVAVAANANLSELGWGKGTARLVLFGSTEFGENQNLTSFFNRDFFVNSADWLAGEENQISIRPRSLRASRFRLTIDQFSVIFALSLLMLPELVIIAGVAVWWDRRS